MKSSITKDNEPGFRILKSSNCPSLSGKTKLSYQIGCDDESEVHFRIIANTNPGCFNTDWVSLKAIQTAFAKNLHGDVITADTLLPLFRGKSLNTSFFICAALKNEALIDNHPEKKRCYAAMDPRRVHGRSAGVDRREGNRQEEDGETQASPQRRPRRARKRNVLPRSAFPRGHSNFAFPTLRNVKGFPLRPE